MSPPDASACRTATCSSSLPGSMGTSPAPPVSDSLSAFVIMWRCCFSMRCKRCASWAASIVSVSFIVRRHSGALSTTILGNGGFAPSLSAVTFSSTSILAPPSAATQTFPVRRFSSITQCLSCPTFASHNSILRDAQKLLMIMNDQQRFLELCGFSDTVFSDLTKPNFLSKLRLAFSIFDQFSSFHSSFHLCPILTLFMTCAAKRGSQLSAGLFVRLKFEEFCTVVSLLSELFSHDRWPCVQPHVVLAESLPLLNLRESPHLGVLSCSVQFHFSIQGSENVVFDVDRNEFVLSMPIHQSNFFSFLTNFVVTRNHVSTVMSEVEILSSFARDFCRTARKLPVSRPFRDLSNSFSSYPWNCQAPPSGTLSPLAVRQNLPSPAPSGPNPVPSN